MSKPLYFHDGPLVWVDCEMTGLVPGKDKIIEIAVRVLLSKQLICTSCFDGHGKVLITNGNLKLVDPGIEYVIRTDKEVLDGLVFNLSNLFTFYR